MSKTVDDLVKVYIIAHFGADNGPRNRERYRAGIAAVIRALRDEFENEMGKCLDCSASGVHDHLDEVFNRILGDAGADAARKSYWDKHYGVDEPTAPATDPAPAVCEWAWERPSATSYYGWYRTSHGERTRAYSSSLGKCIACGKPIKFTEAK